MNERIFDFGELRRFYFEFNETKYFNIYDTEYLVNKCKCVLTLAVISLFIKKHPKRYQILDEIIEQVKGNIEKLSRIDLKKEEGIGNLDSFLRGGIQK